MAAAVVFNDSVIVAVELIYRCGLEVFFLFGGTHVMARDQVWQKQQPIVLFIGFHGGKR